MNPRIAIVGAGIAGVGVARALRRRGIGAITVFERDRGIAPGASSKNFGLVRVLGIREPLVTMTRRTLALLRELDRSAPGIVHQTGMMIYWAPGELPRPRTTGVDDASDYDEILELAAAAKVHVEPLTAAQACERVPGLRQEVVTRALYSRDDAVIDLARLFGALSNELATEGVQVINQAVQRVLVARGSVVGLELVDGTRVDADAVVVASGAWVPDLAKRSGLEVPALVVSRRHLVRIPVTPPLPIDVPCAVRVAQGFCVHGVLGAAVGTISDYTKINPDECTIDPAVAVSFGNAFRESFTTDFPAGSAVGWAGTRVQRELPGFVSGGHTYPQQNGGVVRSPEDSVRGLFWLAGLGGRGISCGLAVASDLADEIASTLVAS